VWVPYVRGTKDDDQSGSNYSPGQESSIRSSGGKSSLSLPRDIAKRSNVPLLDDHDGAHLGGQGADAAIVPVGDSMQVHEHDASEARIRRARQVLVRGFKEANRELKVDIEFRNICWELPPPTSKVILSNVSGSFRSSRVSAAMGPSGAGKTSLLNVLMGKVPRTSGELRINGHLAETSYYKKMVGFVP